MICVSIVSHGHDRMLPALVEQLLGFTEVAEIILTFNIPSQGTLAVEERVTILNNSEPKGYGSNHNEAFKYCNQEYFCILNPDVEFKANPFPELLLSMKNTGASLIAPKVVNSKGEVEISVRKFPNVGALFKKLLLKGKDDESYPQTGIVYPDWVSGLFMLIQSRDFKGCGGFDEAYFLYYEDVDLCTRFQKSNKIVVADMNVAISHDGQRTSHKSLRYARWHLMSMCRYLMSN